MRFLSNPRVSTAAKFTVAAVLLTWMIRSGKLDLSRLAGTLTHWPQLLAIVMIHYLTLCMMAWRWNLLLGAQDFTLGYSEAFSLTMIGSLFNVVIPGVVGGDILKAYYVCRRRAEKTPEVMATVLIDRVIGLLGLLMLAAVAALCSLGLASSSPALRWLSLFAIGSTLAGVIGLVVAVAVGGRAANAEQEQSRPWVASIRRAIGSLGRYQRNPGVLVSALGVSVLNQLLYCVAFYLAAQTLEGSAIPWRYCLLLVPLGLITTAIPISPAGLGVGQAAFLALFQLVPGGRGAFGADAFTVFQILMILVYLTGLYSYLTYEQALRQPVPAAAPSECGE